MGDLIPHIANHRTAARLKAQREAEKMRLIDKIGIEASEVYLHEEELRFLAYEESLRRGLVDLRQG